MKRLSIIGAFSAMLISLAAFASPALADITVSVVPVTNLPEQATIKGTVTAGDSLTIKVFDSALPSGQESVIYSVLSGDTRAKIAKGLSTAINADTNLSAHGISAVVHKNIVTIKSNSPNTTTYSSSKSAGATENITLSANENVPENVTVGGTATAGDVLNLVVTDSGLPGGSKTLGYTVHTGDSVSTMAAGLAAAVNADTNLKGLGITATSVSSGIVTITSYSPNTTTYSGSVTGGTETLTLNENPNTVQDLVIGGTPAAGNVITVDIQDTALIAGGEVVGYKVKAADTTTTIATKLKNAINADSRLAALGIEATSASNVIAMSSGSNDGTSITGQISASGIGCTVVPGYTGPGVLKACGTASITDAQVQVVKATLQALGSQTQYSGGPLTNSATKLQAATDLTWFVFGNRVEYLNSAVSDPATQGTPGHVWTMARSARGATFLSDPGYPTVKPYSVILENFGFPGMTVNDQMAHTTAHETGHLLDFIYGGRTSMYSTGSTSSSQDDALFFLAHNATICGAFPLHP